MLKEHNFDFPLALIRMSYFGDIGMSEMIGLMRLHVQEVVRYTSLIAFNISLSETQVSDFSRDCKRHNMNPDVFLEKRGNGTYFSFVGLHLCKICAKVHDIGKPFFREIYSLERSLTKEEYELQKLHTNLGRLLILSWGHECPILKEYPDLVRFVAENGPSHQEKYDGSGYPDGLKARNIPFIARLLAITDVISALINQRPYRDPVQLKTCMEILKKDSNKHFDPELTAQVLSLYKEGVFTEEKVRGKWVEKTKFSEHYLQYVKTLMPSDFEHFQGDKKRASELQKIVHEALLKNKQEVSR